METSVCPVMKDEASVMRNRATATMSRTSPNRRSGVRRKMRSFSLGPMAVEAMQHGAFDFLQKPFRDQDLLDRVQRALERDAHTRTAFTARATIRERIQSLTPREHEVMRLVTMGKANKVIGAELGVSQRTVEIHRAHVMEKMQANSLAALVRMALDAAEDTDNS